MSGSNWAPPAKPLDQLVHEIGETGPTLLYERGGRIRPLGLGDPDEHDVVFLAANGGGLAAPFECADNARACGEWVGFLVRGEVQARPINDWKKWKRESGRPT